MTPLSFHGHSNLGIELQSRRLHINNNITQQHKAITPLLTSSCNLYFNNPTHITLAKTRTNTHIKTDLISL